MRIPSASREYVPWRWDATGDHHAVPVFAAGCAAATIY